MREDDKFHGGFMIPESFTNQLNEYTQGYMLLVCNERGELYAHESYDNPVIKLGLIKFGDLHISAALKHMHNQALQEEQQSFRDFEDEQEDDPGEGLMD
jgi:hypothetical protein